jgi:trk system potassium uptake protein TrkA
LDTVVIWGNGTDYKILEDAQIEDADVFVAATGDDNANLMAALLAKEYKPDKIIARVNDPQHEKVFLESDMVEIIRPETTEAGYLEKLILKPQVADLYVVDKGQAEILEIEVKSDKIIGKTINELSPTDDYIICGYCENNDDKITICKPEMVLKYGDKISILSKRDSTKKVLEKFTV